MKLLKNINNFIFYLLIFTVTFEFWDIFGSNTGDSTNEEVSSSITRNVSLLYMVSSFPFLKERLSFKVLKYFLVPFYLYVGCEMVGSLIYISHIKSYADMFPFRVIQLTILMLLISSHLIEQPKLLKKTLHIYVHSILLLAVLYYFGFGVDVGYEEGVSRLYLFGENPNNTGFKISIALLIIFYILFEEKKPLFIKLYYIFILVSVIPILAATGSRGPIVILFLSLLYYVVKLKISVGRRILLFMVASIASVFMAQAIMRSELMASRINMTIEEGHIGGRDELWESSLAVFSNNPWFGVGKNAYKIEIGKYYGRPQSSHNIFIEVLVRAGFLGFIAYMFFFFRIWGIALQAYKQVGISIFILIIFATSLQMSKAGGAMQNIFLWFLISVVIGAMGTYLNPKHNFRNIS